MTTSDLKIIFEKEYNRAEWTNALREIFHIRDLHISPQEVNLGENTFGASAFELGSFETSEGLLVGLYEINITPELRLDHNKVGLRNLMRKVYSNDGDAALMVFTQGHTWRFTYASELTVINKETGKREARQTDPKRFTYIFGENQFCRTATDRFAGIKPTDQFAIKVSIKEIEKAFSVDTLTKDFYKDLFTWYQWALSDNDGFAVTFPNDTSTEDDDRKIDEHIIRLITRLIFVWFIKQKNLIPEQIFQTSELKNILKDFDPVSKTTGNYYNAILQNLFFATLNRAINDRQFAKIGPFHEQKEHFGIKTLFRNAENGSWFNQTNEEVLQLFRKVPFLNGGLFECLDKADENGKFFYYDGFSRRAGRQKRAFLPNCLFFDPEKGLIPLLEKYNFTIEENTPNNVEVALDPELLGNVFENLLGAYNPETKETARKQSGSFYTPREIVNYMVDESLIAYLNTVCPDLATEIIRELFNSETLPTGLQDQPELNGKIAEKLKEIKILDPACGSGAFPMGVLNRMLDLLKKLHTESEHSNYDLKLQLIENCIYGIDIQTIAVQIAKLRFFISLICEQIPTSNPDENYGITSLPNLETKFVAANTLLGLKEGFSNKLDFQDEYLLGLKTNLWDVRHKHFLAGNANEKHTLRKEDKNLRDQIKKYLIESSSVTDFEKVTQWQNESERLKTESLKYADEKWVDVTETPKLQIAFDFGFEPPIIQQQSLFKVDVNKQKRDGLETKIKRLENEINREVSKTINIGFEAEADKLAHWDPYNQNKSSDFFDAEWMFGIKNGFDVVIGNPPYVQLQKESGKLAEQLKNQNFETFERTGDIYSLFYEKGFSFLANKGLLTFITSNKWMRTNYGKSTRNFFTEKTNPLLIIDFGNVQIFENATVDTNILIIQKSLKSNYTKACRFNETYNKTNIFENYIIQNSQSISFAKDESWIIADSKNAKIIEKIRNQGVPLKNWNISISRGIVTGLNEAFVIDAETKDRLIREDPKSVEILRPILRGKDIQKWVPEYAGLWLIATFPSLKIKIENYSKIRDFLLEFGKEKLIQDGTGRKKTGNYWFETQDQIVYWPNFNKPKIIYPNMTKYLPFVYDENDHYYHNDKSFHIVGESLKWLIAFLNSSLFKFTFSDDFPELQGGTRELRKVFFDKIPVKQLNEKKQQPFIDLVDNILTDKKSNPKADTTLLEREIDELVYKLYELTYDEVKVIDPGFWLSEEEYNQVRIE